VTFVVDVSEADFEREVLERSDDVPVVVDVWAPWCGPCRVLGPILERLAEEYGGAFVLARLNADEAPRLAQALGARAIPAVRAFRARKIVAEFEGAQPEASVRRFLDALLPSEADAFAAAGDAALASGDAAVAEREFHAALASDPRHPLAMLGLARTLAARGEAASALDWLDRIGPGTPASEPAARLAAELRTAQEGGVEDEAGLRARLAADPADPAARLALGRLLARAGRHEDALAELLEAVRRDPHYADDAARLAMLDLFAILGGDDPLTQRFRPALARALFR
jgi:putative thioredoxin